MGSEITDRNTLGDSLRLVAITIPNNGGNGTTIDALKGAQDWDDEIISWHIVENADAFQYGTEADFSGATPTIDAELGWAPPLRKQAMLDLFLRSSSGSTVAAILACVIATGSIARS